MANIRQAGLLACVSTFALLAGGASAYAQSDAEAANGAAERAGERVDQVYVTARKRVESIQDVPSAVTAISASQLAAGQVQDITDIKDMVPNLYLEKFNGSNVVKLFMRGIGVDNSVFSFDAPVGIYVDGVYLARALGAAIDTFDVERVEFLRGPQGTLYGRNNTAGALRIITRNPSLEDYEFKAQFGYGTKSQINTQTYLSAPLIPGKLGARIALSTRNNDGWMTNVTTGQDGFMNENTFTLRGGVLYQPTDSLKISLRGDYTNDQSNAAGSSDFRNNPDNDLYTFESEVVDLSGNHTKPWGVSGTVEWSGDSVNVTSITAYRGLDVVARSDADGKPFRVFEVPEQGLQENQFTQEIYATGQSTLAGVGVDWTTGAFYLNEQNDFIWSLAILPGLLGEPTVQFFDQATNSAAVYAEGDFHLTDRLTVTGGARYTYEEKDLHVDGVNPDGSPNFEFDGNMAAYRWTWKASANYAFTDDFMAYFQAGTGFRSGGFDGSARNEAQVLDGAFGPETAFSVEGGFKSEWFDNRVRLNATYFYVEYEGLQFAITTNAGIAATNADASVRGLELELNAVVAEGLTFDATLGTMSDDIADASLALKNTPDWKGRLGFTYNTILPNSSGELTLAAHASYTDDVFVSTANDPDTIVPGHELVDAVITYTSPDGHWQAGISGKNLTNQVYATHIFDIADGAISGTLFPSLGRRFLGTLTYKF